MVVRRGLGGPIAGVLGEGDPRSHILTFTELNLDVRHKFLQSSSISPSPRRGNVEDGMRMQGSMMNSPWMASCSSGGARKLIGRRGGGAPAGD